MKKKLISPLLFTAVVLAACGLAINFGFARQQGAAQQQALEAAAEATRLALATLELEQTGPAIEAQQADELLFLWKGMRSLVGSSTAATIEIEGLTRQIQEGMSADQLEAIARMELDAGASFAVSAGSASDTATDEEASSSQAAALPAINGQTPGEGGLPAGEMPMGEPGQAPTGGSMPGGETGTPDEASSLQASSAASISLTLLNSVITLLEEKLA